MNQSELASAEEIKKEQIKNFVRFLVSRMPGEQTRIKRAAAQYLKGAV